MITVIEAPEFCPINVQNLTVFLGGGITNCPDWQNEVIDELNVLEKEYPELGGCIFFNPRRKTFDITDKSASDVQVEWEQEKLMNSTIFTMYFSAGDSPQPICFFELGRYATLNKNYVISYDKDFCRVFDVKKQCFLMGVPAKERTPKEHAKAIAEKIRTMVE